MDLAAIIIASISLVASFGCLSIMLAKNFFSTHVVQLQPVESLLPTGLGGTQKITDPYMEFDQKPLDEDEKDYFKRQN